MLGGKIGLMCWKIQQIGVEKDRTKRKIIRKMKSGMNNKSVEWKKCVSKFHSKAKTIWGKLLRFLR